MLIDNKGDLVIFRSGIRDWIAETLPRDWSKSSAQTAEAEAMARQRWWCGELVKQGLAVPHWPAEFGGADLGLAGQMIIADEIARAGAPGLSLFTVGLNHVPGTLIPFGTADQRSAHLPAIARGETIWCQGFSEPSAGSDLASLRCRAVLDGDHYVVNGQKIWSSFSRYAQQCILLVRTDPGAPKHAGITFLLMDMDTPGVEVRRIEQIDGHAEFSELFLTDVRIPVSNRVGAENEGWKVAQATLASERGVLAFEEAERQRYKFAAFLKAAVHNDAAWLKDDELRRRFLSLTADLQASRRLIRQLLLDHQNGEPHAKTAMTSAHIKLFQTTLIQRIGDLVTRICGLEGQRFEALYEQSRFVGMFDFVFSYCWTISGGTNEIMRNIIAERGLGLPKG